MYRRIRTGSVLTKKYKGLLLERYTFYFFIVLRKKCPLGRKSHLFRYAVQTSYEYYPIVCDGVFVR